MAGTEDKLTGNKSVDYIPQRRSCYRLDRVHKAEINKKERTWRYYIIDASQAVFFLAAGICMGLMMSFGFIVG